MTLEQLEEGLSKIGYSIKGKYPNRFIYDNNNKRVKPILRVWNDSITLELKSKNVGVYFGYKNIQVDFVEQENYLSIGTENQLIILYKQ
jgi:hypothetical protein